MSRFSSYAPLLKSVSRSFYLSLRIVPAPLRNPIGLAYLLCRLADSIADTDVLPPEKRLSGLLRFRHLFDGDSVEKNDVAALQTLLTSPLQPQPTSEGQLISRWDECMEAYAFLPPSQRTLVAAVVKSVIEGMEMDLQHFSSPSLTAFDNDAQLERYLVLIGGEPGRFWTDICLDRMPSLASADVEDWRKEGIYFGTGLQMVNILKDVFEDVRRNRCYLPAAKLSLYGLSVESIAGDILPNEMATLRDDLIQQTSTRLEAGVRYIKRLPAHAFRLRWAVWWPLALGMMTLRAIGLTPLRQHQRQKPKVTKLDLWKMVALSLVGVGFNRWVDNQFNGMKEELRGVLHRR